MIEIQDYTHFNPVDYLNEYWWFTSIEDPFLLEFYHQVYGSLPYQNRFLEIGGGPTIYQFISACTKIETIVFAEYLEVNRQEVRK